MTTKQRAFCENYTISHDGKTAAIAAGFTPDGAAKAAKRLLQNPEIMAYVDYLAAGADDEEEEETETEQVTMQTLIDFWGSVVSGFGETTENKLKASILLARYLSARKGKEDADE